jgi:hypothetical protein
MDLPLARLPDLLRHEAPYLSEKLLKLKVVRTAEEAVSLFSEVKKYLVLCELHRDSMIPMFSRRIDEVWHQLVLFTAHYEDFSRTYFGKFVHHDPVEADADEVAPIREMTFAEFRAAYEARFGDLSEAWFDELSVEPASRLLRATWRGPFAVRSPVADKAELIMQREPPVVVCRVDARAADALAFLVACDKFHVRELPGLADDAERVQLCKALVKIGVLSVAP